MSASAAAVEAARLRFRPILMTSLAFIFGVLPLAISTGAGAGARHSTGTGVMGGMIAATFLAIFFVPLFYPPHHRSPPAREAQQGAAAGRGRASPHDGAQAPPPHAGPSAAWRYDGRPGMKRRLIPLLVAAVLAGCAVTQPVVPEVRPAAGHRDRRAERAPRALVDRVQRSGAHRAHRRSARQQPRPAHRARAHRGRARAGAACASRT